MPVGSAAVMSKPSAATFDPFSLGWYAASWADDPSWSNPGNGNAVSSWRDGSGNNRAQTQATGSKQPLFRTADSNINGKSCVDYDGTDDWTTATNWSNLAAPFTVIWIGYYEAITNNARAVDMGWSIQGFPSIAPLTGSGKWGMYQNGQKTSTVAYATNTATAIRGLFVNGTGTAFTVNGTTSTTGANAAPTTAQASRFNVASSQTDSTDYASQRCAFAGIYSGDITANGSWSSFVSWVSSYYGLTIA